MSLSSLATATAEVGDRSSVLPHNRCCTHVNPANVGQNGKNWLHVCRRTSDMKRGRSYVENLPLLTSTDRLLPRAATIPSSSSAAAPPLAISSDISTAELLGLIPRSASLPTHQPTTHHYVTVVNCTGTKLGSRCHLKHQLDKYTVLKNH